MAEVFLAKATSTRGDKRLVALKRMHITLTEDQSAVQMLIEEARLCMRFHHPNIAQTFELGCHDGTYFFIMEYVDGVDLGTLANLVEAHGGRLDPAAVAFLCAGMARGLDYAHNLCDESGKRLGIVHRDVSPQNVLLARKGEVKLIDFGVAKVASRIQQTMAGIIKGKYAYMSPEQASAEPIDARSDVFSLGICLHELFTGRPLFRALGAASPFAILRAVRDDPIPNVCSLVPELPAEVGRIVARALERDQGKRYPSCGALAADLEAWLKSAAPQFNATELAAYVQEMVQQAPQGALPQNAIATPPLAKMSGEEFEPDGMSVVAASPLELAKHVTIAARRPSPPSLPSAPTMAVAAVHAQRSQAGEALSSGADRSPVSPVSPAVANEWRPSRRATMQFLWVGLAALVFVVGWSVMATLVKTGRL
jgi:serine/threonine protein kinase